jgi:hypothetical protein
VVADSNVRAVAEDYCDLCDLPLSTCIHGMPAPPPAPAPAARAPRAPRALRATGEARAPRATATPKRTAAAVRPSAPRVRTDQEAFRPFIIRLLKDEGALETAEVMELLAEQMADVLLDRDKQKAPTGEIRWHTAARAERKAMIDEGLMAPAKGIWQLTDRGRAASY